MDNVFFDNPPVLQGNERTQLQQLGNYLYTLSSKLNEALMTVTIETEEKIREQAETGIQAQESKDVTTLKALIVKTAEIVRTEMQEIRTELHAETVAISEDVGTLESELDQRITATAQGVLQEFESSETIQDTITNTFYRRRTNEYIFTGILDPDTGEVGIAIGEGVTAYDSDGNPYLNQAAKCATFTKDRMTFWQEDTELAYFSSGKFYIMNGEITNTLQIGIYTWKAMADNSMALLGP